jgi:glutamate carboxypeptidase
MKGGLVIALHALEALESLNIPVRWSFILNADEETGSFHSDRALRSVAKSHDLGLALEPAMPDGGLVVERPGSGQFMIECHGRAAHVGRDFTNGVSAVSLLAERVLRVARIPRPTMGIVANVGPLEGGIATNVVPDRARAWGNVRFPTTPDADYLKSSIQALATSNNSMPRANVELVFNRPAKPLTPAVQALADLARAAAELLGQALPFGKTGGVCDGNNLQAAGLPVIDTLGVRGGGLHTPQEWIELKSLVERCQLLALLLCRLSRGGWPPSAPSEPRP